MENISQIEQLSIFRCMNEVFTQKIEYLEKKIESFSELNNDLKQTDIFNNFSLESIAKFRLLCLIYKSGIKNNK